MSLFVAASFSMGLWTCQAAAQLSGATLYSPPVWADHFVCTVVNTSNTKRSVTAKIIDQSGTELSTSPIAGGCTLAYLNPGQACGVMAPSGYVHLAYCRIQVPLGSKEDVRGSLRGSTIGGTASVAVSAQ